MSDKYRKLTTEELATYGLKTTNYYPSIVSSIKECFGSGAARIFVSFNCEYNDSTYDFRGLHCIEVYNKNGDMMVPLKEKIEKWRKQYREFTPQDFNIKSNFGELSKCLDDLIINLTIPELYVKIPS